MPFTRPENALARAEELLAVDRPLPAVQMLIEVLKNRRHRTGSALFRDIIRKYLDLCVTLRDSEKAKDGLYQYRNICQGTNAVSLEEVMVSFLRTGDARAEEARRELELHRASAGLSCPDGDEEFECVVDPCVLMRAADTGVECAAAAALVADGRDPVTEYAAWLRFAWDSHKMCLDLLKNNNRVERQYKLMADLCLRFVLKYQRRTEFRKLCDALRQHLNLTIRSFLAGAGVAGAAAAGFSPKLDNAETVRLLLDTRLSQFDVAVRLNTWQEAFKALEDVNTLRGKTRLQCIQPQQFVSYHWKLACALFAAGYDAYHAHALLTHFKMYRDQKANATPAELARVAARLVLAVLSVPVVVVVRADVAAPAAAAADEFSAAAAAAAADSGGGAERHKALCALVRTARPPDRRSLLRELAAADVFAHLPAGSGCGRALRRIRDTLEADFSPHTIRNELEECLAVVARSSSSSSSSSSKPAAPLSPVTGDRRDWDVCAAEPAAALPDYLVDQYAPKLRAVATSRVLQHVSKMYASIETHKLVALLCCRGGGDDNALSLQLTRVFRCRAASDLQIDDLKHLAAFRHGFHSRPSAAAAAASEQQQQEEEPIQPSMRDVLRNQLVRNASVSKQAIARIINVTKLQDPLLKKTQARRADLVAAHLLADRQLAAKRAQAIEQFKKIKEVKLIQRRQTELEILRLRQENAARLEEKFQRDQCEQRQRLKQAEVDKQKKKMTKDMIMMFDVGRKLIEGKTEEEIEKIDIREIERQQNLEERRLARERRLRLKKQAKRVDYLYRAFHSEQIAEWKARSLEQVGARRRHWDAKYAQLVAKEAEALARAVAERTRLARMKPAADALLAEEMVGRRAAADARMADFCEKRAEVRARVAARRREARVVARRAAVVVAEEAEEAEAAEAVVVMPAAEAPHKYVPPHLKKGAAEAPPPPPPPPPAAAAAAADSPPPPPPPPPAVARQPPCLAAPSNWREAAVKRRSEIPPHRADKPTPTPPDNTRRMASYATAPTATAPNKPPPPTAQRPPNNNNPPAGRWARLQSPPPPPPPPPPSPGDNSHRPGMNQQQEWRTQRQPGNRMGGNFGQTRNRNEPQHSPSNTSRLPQRTQNRTGGGAPIGSTGEAASDKNWRVRSKQ